MNDLMCSEVPNSSNTTGTVPWRDRRQPRRNSRWLSLLLQSFFVISCARHPARLVPREAILEEQLVALTQLAAKARDGPILTETEALIAVDGRLLQDLLTAAMPIETIVDHRYAIRLDSASVSLDDGLALVRLGGRATLVGQSKEQSFADATVYGALDDLEFDPDAAVLRGRIRVIAFDATKVRLFGNEDATVRRLALGLSRLRLGSFEELSYSLEIPVQLGRSITLPQVGPEGGVHIPEARIPLSLQVTAVRAFHGRLWVSARLAASPESGTGGSLPESAAGPPKTSPARMRKRGRVQPFQRSTPALVTALQDSVSALLAKDPVVCAVQENIAPVLVILPEGLLQTLVRSVTASYLDRVELNLGPEVAHETGVIKVSSPFGKITAGHWGLEVTIHRVSGVLRHGAPRVSLAGGGRLGVEIPARIEGGKGSATIDFNWDPSSLGSILCRGFRIRRTIEGVVKPQEHLIRGSLRIAAGERSLTAYPEFADEKFPIQLDMTKASWDDVRAALEQQDHLLKCGAVMDPDDMVNRLKDLGNAGIRIGLPRVVFRSFDLPASLTKSVRIAGRSVALSVRPEGVRTSGGALWYGAAVEIESSYHEVLSH